MDIRQHQVFLNDLVKDVTAGRLGIPKFQRPYSWTEDDVEKLFASILRRWPIGAFVVWQPSSDVDMASVSRGRIGPIASAEQCASYLLDGQNRLASFAWAFGGDAELSEADLALKEREVWLSGRTLVADFSAKKIMFVPEDAAHGHQRLPLGEILQARLQGSRRLFEVGNRILDAEGGDEAFDWLFDEVPTCIQEARVVVTSLNQANIEEAKEAFLHICKVGQPISEEDFERAVSWTVPAPGTDASSSAVETADHDDEVKSLLAQGWEVEKTTLYDEEGVEGWRWTSPEGHEYSIIGNWDEPPVVPEHLQMPRPR